MNMLDHFLTPRFNEKTLRKLIFQSGQSPFSLKPLDTKKIARLFDICSTYLEHIKEQGLQGTP